MNKRDAKKEAFRIISDHVQSEVRFGWPFIGEIAKERGYIDTSGELTMDGIRLSCALLDVCSELSKRSE